jgi:uracil-DNA glycosylase family 4
MKKLDPPFDCKLCPRLKTFRDQNALKLPDYFNAPVPAFGSLDAELLIVGLAPGLHGANQTGRPFTGDYAGLVLYNGLLNTSFAMGNFDERPDDGLKLVNCRVTNAVRCVPPENKPETSEIANCNDFLTYEIAAMPNLKYILSLGGISHKAVLKSFGFKQSAFTFKHGVNYPLNDNIILFNSYHCSRYNINTNRLTQEMFEDVLKDIRSLLD